MFSRPIEIERSIRQVEHESLKLDPKRRFVVWWYGGIYPNRNSAHVPLVVVWFRLLNNDNTLGYCVKESITISLLRQFRIGSIWEDKKSKEQLVFDHQNFKVRFSGDHWKNTLSVGSHKVATGLNLIPFKNYGLHYPDTDRSQIISLRGESGTLLMPCIEFFARCYGHCEELNRVLANYGWSEVEDYFRLQDPITPQTGIWTVRLPYFAQMSDSHLLAHLRYDEFTKRHTALIQSHIDQALFGTRPSKYAFPPIGPWFEGDAEIEVEGIPLATGDFLGLRITGYSVPSTPPICCEIEEVHSPAGEEEGGGRPRPSFNTALPPEDQTTPTTDIHAPDPGSNAVIVRDPAIRILGNAAPITVRKNIKESEGGKRSKPPEDSERSAAGERNGSGTGTGRAYFNSQAVLDTDGAIIKLWNGLLYLKNEYPKSISSVSWYTFDQGLNDDELLSPRLVVLAFGKNEDGEAELSPAAEKWIRFDSKIADKVRGALIVRVTSPDKEAYLFEVQRKLIHTKESDTNTTIVKEQQYCGLIVEPPNGQGPESWIPGVLFQIAEQLGIMGKVVPLLSGLNASDYRRTWSTSNVVPGESTARSALRKVGISIPAVKKSPNKKSGIEN